MLAFRCRAAVCRGFGIVMVHDANATYTQVRYQQLQTKRSNDTFMISKLRCRAMQSP